MKHVLGMAKRHLDLRGAKGPKIELDFLRLLVAVRGFRDGGEDAKGYLLVMTPTIKQRVEGWCEKYSAEDAIEILVPDLTPDEQRQLQRESRANVRGMLAGTLGKEVRGRSDARPGASLTEAKLSTMIELHEPGVRRVEDPSQFPLDISWDYCGTVLAAWSLVR